MNGKKPDYELKAQVIESKIDLIVRKISQSEYIINKCIDRTRGITGPGLEFNYNQWLKENIYDCKLFDLSQCDHIRKMIINQFGNEFYNECVRVNKAYYARKKRLSDKITNMILNNNCIFLTLTFTDKVLNNTSKETRKRYITRFLKENCIEYIANIDYGANNEREHYHAIVVANNDTINNKNYKYGNIDFKRVNDNIEQLQETSVKISKYISKLTNHAIKNTTKRECIIYSR